MIWLFAAVMVLWGSNCILALREKNGRILFLLFHITIFTFLLGRPLMTLFGGLGLVKFEVENYGATEESVFQALVLIFLSLLGLRIGAMISKRLECFAPPVKNAGQKEKDVWKMAALILFAQSCLCEVFIIAEKVWFIVHHSYVAYYAEFVSQMPYIIYVCSTFVSFTLCIWLAFLPEKKKVTRALVVYVLLQLPMAVCGARREFVLTLLFSMTYFFFRDYLDGKASWICALEKKMMVFGGIGGIIFLGLLNYLREGVKSAFTNPFLVIMDFFFKQGVTFSWLSAGLAHAEALKNQGVFSYTFGAFIDWLFHGTIARLFGATSLGSVNSLVNARESNMLAYHLSYTLLGEERYLAGHGTGSCYFLEIFLDFGYAGVLLGGMLLGMITFSFFFLAKRNVFLRSVLLMMTAGLLYLPRAEALRGINFLWRPPFLLSYAGVFLMGTLLKNIRGNDF